MNQSTSVLIKATVYKALGEILLVPSEVMDSHFSGAVPKMWTDVLYLSATAKNRKLKNPDTRPRSRCIVHYLTQLQLQLQPL